jgi:hypothetical protein
VTVPPEPGYRLKLRRAKEHLDFIASEGARFIQEHLDAALPFEPEPENKWTILKRGNVQPLSPMWGTYLGDAVHNTRAGLDQFLCALILRANPYDSVEHVQFPVYEGRQQWLNDIERRDRSVAGRAPTDGLPADLLAIVEQAQPYHLSGAAKKRAPLLLLVIASNADKHRAVHEAFPRIAPRDIHAGLIKVIPGGYFAVRKAKIAAPGTPIESGAEVGRMKVRIVTEPPPDTEVGVHIVAPMEIAFRIPGKPLVTTHWDLWAMLSTAWNIVLEMEGIAGIHGLPTPGPDWVVPGIAVEAPPPRSRK